MRRILGRRSSGLLSWFPPETLLCTWQRAADGRDGVGHDSLIAISGLKMPLVFFLYKVI